MSRIRSATVLGRKAVELGLREVGIAPEMVQARRLAASQFGAVASTGTRVLMLSPRDWAVHVQWEALIAHALRLRGADVHTATCGGGLEICDRINVHEGPPPPCHTCNRYTSAAVRAHGFDPLALVDEPADSWPELDELTLEELRAVVWQGMPLGELVDVPVKWFLCSAALGSDALGALTYRRFLRAARVIAAGAERVLDSIEPDVIVLLNGLFLFEAVAGALAHKRGVRVVTYERGHIDGTLFFSHEQPASRYSVDAFWPEAAERPLSEQEARRLDKYLDDRRHGLRSFVQIWPSPDFGTEPPPASTAIRQVALFTNVTWDSAAIGLDAAFDDVREWLIACIRQLGGRPDVRLIVRVHPSEVVLPAWRTREPMQQVIDDAFPILPANVQIVGADSSLSSYSIMESADVGLVYTSTSGLELALGGTPVVLGGRPHYANKGFTLDPPDAAEHERLLDAALADPEAYRPDVSWARRYANLFFFDVPIPQPPASEPLGGLARIDISNLDALRPGAHMGVDVICDGILDGAPFRSR